MERSDLAGKWSEMRMSAGAVIRAKILQEVRIQEMVLNKSLKHGIMNVDEKKSL